MSDGERERERERGRASEREKVSPPQGASLKPGGERRFVAGRNVGR